MKKHLILSTLATALFLSGGLAFAVDQATTDGKASQKQDSIYGYQLMTPQERTEYHNKMRAAKTPEEREKIRKEHHDLMKARAKERGVTLPDEPPARGGMGPHGGMGHRGMEPGGGMGPGGARNQ